MSCSPSGMERSLLDSRAEWAVGHLQTPTAAQVAKIRHLQEQMVGQETKIHRL